MSGAFTLTIGFIPVTYLQLQLFGLPLHDLIVRPSQLVNFPFLAQIKSFSPWRKGTRNAHIFAIEWLYLRLR
jgi:hypothetical protein